MKQLFERICNKFALETINAPMRSTYVLGTRVNAKNDIRREFIANLKMIRELATLRGDHEVLAMCNGQIVSELNAIKAELEQEMKGNMESE